MDKIDLSEATEQQIADELMRRDTHFVLAMEEGKATAVYLHGNRGKVLSMLIAGARALHLETGEKPRVVARLPA